MNTLNQRYTREETRIYRLYWSHKKADKLDKNNKDELKMYRIQQKCNKAVPTPLCFEVTHKASVDVFGNTNTLAYSQENIDAFKEALEELRTNNSFCRSLTEEEWNVAHVQSLRCWQTRFVPKEVVRI